MTPDATMPGGLLLRRSLTGRILPIPLVSPSFPTTSTEQFEEMLQSPEGTHLEFKRAENRFAFEELAQYCVALANEGGGKMVLGVTDTRPRIVVGTFAFPEPGRTEAGLHEQLGNRVPIEEYSHADKRVLIAHVPSRLPGTPWSYKGSFYKREGDSLVPMIGRDLEQIFAEIAPDFSAELCTSCSVQDLDASALDTFRSLLQKRQPFLRVEAKSDAELLEATELALDDLLTNAALILLGSAETLSRHLPQAEVIFEYRSTESAGPAQDRQEYREAFIVAQQKLWSQINLRNDRQSYQEDFFRYDIPTFDEAAIREAILNAVCHRDYRHSGSVFIRQYPRRLEITNPGGFPPGVTVDNIADQQNPRNRRLAEILQRCGLIERSGQGVNLMIEKAIRQTKPLPDYSQSSAHEVRLILAGTVQDPAFIRFLERLGEDQLQTFNTLDFLVLDALSRDLPLSGAMKARLPRLVEIGAIESQGRGRGRRYFLSRELYAEMGNPGAYTRRKGLDHETNKELLIKHLKTQGSEGAPISELRQVLPACSPATIRRCLNELRSEGRVELGGRKRGSRWFLVIK